MGEKREYKEGWKMTAWETLRSLDLLEAFEVFTPAFFTAMGICLALYLAIAIYRSIHGLRVAGHVVLKPRSTTWWRLVYCLNLEGTRVTDAGLEYLGQLKSLHTLSLKNTKVTSLGLIHLKRLPELRSVYIGGTVVKQAALAEVLPGVSAESSCPEDSSEVEPGDDEGRNE